jgi:peptidoglycan/xylan/chitin deacetylase (PgdA/CDA1 family)
MATSPSIESHPVGLPPVESALSRSARTPRVVRPIDHLALSALLPTGLLRRMHAPDYLAFCYHCVSAPVAELVHYIYDYKSPSEFEDDVLLLARKFGLADATPFAFESAPIPERRGRALLTFDDGFQEWDSNVLPILGRRNANAIMFVTTGLIDNRRMLEAHAASLAIGTLVRADPEQRGRMLDAALPLLSLPADAPLTAAFERLRGLGDSAHADQLGRLLHAWGIDTAAYLRERQPYLSEAAIVRLRDGGCVIGAHGIDHRNLNAVPADELRRQVVESCMRIREITGQAKVPFAFPFSRRIAASGLQALRECEPVIGAIFGTGGIRTVPTGFHERVVGDWRFTPALRRLRSPLLLMLNRAYLAKASEYARHRLGHSAIPYLR